MSLSEVQVPYDNGADSFQKKTRGKRSSVPQMQVSFYLREAVAANGTRPAGATPKPQTKIQNTSAASLQFG
jgi:hypothetical protein